MICKAGGPSMGHQLAALELERRELNEDSSQEDIDCHFNAIALHRKEAEEALQRAEREAREAGFWSDVAQVATVAAAVGGVVAAGATGGGSLALTLAIAGGVGTLATQTESGQDLLRDELGMSDEQIKWTGVASAAVSVGAGFATVGASAAKAGSEAARQAAAAAHQAAILRAAGMMTAGAGTAVGGVAHYGEFSANSRQTDATADEQAADRSATEASSRLDDKIATVKGDLSRHQANMTQIREMQKRSHETLSEIIQRGRA
ncbi:MAG: hypothetical protein HYZ29_07050 [Myxococcales bacterium]|nr:hypothetical protein [Myxococcales bacterium]